MESVVAATETNERIVLPWSQALFGICWRDGRGSGLENVSHDKSKHSKCDYANRTSLRIVHMLEHCFQLSHDFFASLLSIGKAEKNSLLMFEMELLLKFLALNS